MDVLVYEKEPMSSQFAMLMSSFLLTGAPKREMLDCQAGLVRDAEHLSAIVESQR